MNLLRVFFGLLGFAANIGAQDPIGSTGCSAAACVFANPSLRFGTGAENSVNAHGLFQQPWYYSPTASAWYKLTFANYPLDTAIGLGTGSAQWTGATVTDLYSQTPTVPATDYSNFVVDSADMTKTVGHGKIVARRTFTIQGATLTIQNTFSLGYNDSFVKIVTQLTNNATAQLTNVILWTGTRDDFVGNTDVNTKTRGNLDTGSFVAISANNQSSRAIMITNTNEGVLFYSETAGVMTAYALCCSFSNVYNTNPVTLPPQTPSPTDGSYAAILPLGNVEVGASGSITWYYAAGAVSSLSAVAQTVAAAQVADASPSLSPTVSPTPSITPSVCASSSSTGTPTGTGTGTGTNTSSPTGTGTPTGTRTGTNTSSPTGTGTPTATRTGTNTSSSTGTGTGTPSGTPTGTASGTPSGTASGTASQTLTPTSVALIRPDNSAVQLVDTMISGIIIINIVTAAVIMALCFFCMCCLYSACLLKRRLATRCNYCKEELNGVALSHHLKGCDAFAKENVKRAEVYKTMQAAWA